MKIEIQTSIDHSECETCGSSWAYGGAVFVDGKEILSREPLASCYGSPSFSEADLLVMALKKMGHEVLLDGSLYPVYSHDDEYQGSTLGG